MKILIIPGWYPSPQKPQHGDFVFYQTRELVKRGVDAAVIYADLDFRYWRYLRGGLIWKRHFESEAGIPTFRLEGAGWPKLNKQLLLHWATSFERLYEDYHRQFGQPDLIHAHTFLGGLVANRLSRRIHVPYLVTEHSSSFFSDAIKPWWRPLVKEVLQEAAAVLAVSPALALHLEKNYAGRPVLPFPNFINTDLFKPAEKKAIKEDFSFLAAGSLMPRKGFDLLLLAMKEVLAKTGRPAVSLRILGNGPERKKLLRLTKALGLAAHVSFPGELPNEHVIPELQQADALILPSHKEPFDIILIEAMSCGLPVIATRSGGPESIVTPETGFLVPPNNVGELSSAMINMIRERQRFDAQTIRLYAEENFGAEAVTSRLIQLYQDVIRTGGY